MLIVFMPYADYYAALLTPPLFALTPLAACCRIEGRSRYQVYIWFAMPYAGLLPAYGGAA